MTAAALQMKSAIRDFLAWENDVHTVRGISIKASYVMLQSLDLLLTVFAINIGFTELNPIMRSMLTIPLQLILIKFLIPVVLIWFIPSKFLIPGVAMLLFVVGWNMKELICALL